MTKLDRLARSGVYLGKLIDALEAKGVAQRIVNLGVDTATPTGKLMLNVLGVVAQFEREISATFQSRYAATSVKRPFSGQPSAVVIRG